MPRNITGLWAPALGVNDDGFTIKVRPPRIFKSTPYEKEETIEPDDNLTDVEADAMTLRDAGWGTDEDYGYYPTEDE